MKPTIHFIHEKFVYFNELIFNGKLPLPSFQLTNATSFLGKYQRKELNGELIDVITMSTSEELKEQELEDVLIHEMIHFEIRHLGLQDTSPHGHLFMCRMTWINAVHKRNISVSHRRGAQDEILPSRSKRGVCTVALMCLESGEKGIKVLSCSYNSVNEFMNKVSNVSAVKSVEYYIVNDSFFDKYPRSTALKYYRISDEDIAKHLPEKAKLST